MRGGLADAAGDQQPRDRTRGVHGLGEAEQPGGVVPRAGRRERLAAVDRRLRDGRQLPRPRPQEAGDQHALVVEVFVVVGREFVDRDPRPVAGDQPLGVDLERELPVQVHEPGRRRCGELPAGCRDVGRVRGGQEADRAGQLQRPHLVVRQRPQRRRLQRGRGRRELVEEGDRGAVVVAQPDRPRRRRELDLPVDQHGQPHEVGRLVVADDQRLDVPAGRPRRLDHCRLALARVAPEQRGDAAGHADAHRLQGVLVLTASTDHGISSRGRRAHRSRPPASPS